MGFSHFLEANNWRELVGMGSGAGLCTVSKGWLPSYIIFKFLMVDKGFGF